MVPVGRFRAAPTRTQCTPAEEPEGEGGPARASRQLAYGIPQIGCIGLDLQCLTEKFMPNAIALDALRRQSRVRPSSREL